MATNINYHEATDTQISSFEVLLPPRKLSKGLRAIMFY